jgi:5,10-methylenetetrahydromethanopterin reductase
VSVSGNGDGVVTDALRDMIAYFGPQLPGTALAAVGLGRADFTAIEGAIGRGDRAAARDHVTPAMLRLAITGAPGDVIARIETLAAAGITQVSVGGPLGPDPRQTLRLFGERIIPHFR